MAEKLDGLPRPEPLSNHQAKRETTLQGVGELRLLGRHAETAEACDCVVVTSRRLWEITLRRSELSQVGGHAEGVRALPRP